MNIWLADKRIMLRRLPKWIQELDEGSLDKELLTQIFHSSKKPLSTPREMNFVLMGFKSKDEADNAAHYAQQKGWVSVVSTHSDDTSLYMLEATKQGYAINPHNLFEDEADFARIAKQYGAVYDGWYASVV